MDVNTILAGERFLQKNRKKQARRTITLCLLGCTLLQVAQIVLSFFYTPTEDEVFYILQNIVIYVLSFLIPFGVLALLFSFINKEKQKEHKRYIPRNPFLYICGSIGIGYIFIFSANLILGDLAEKLTIGDPFVPETTAGILLFYLYQAVFPAIIEEWAFRGVILKNLLPFGRRGAILISAILFGVVHIQPIQAGFATVLGLLLAIVYEYTGSLAIPIIIHFLNNAISASTAVFEYNMFVQFALSILVLFFIGCGITFFVKYSKRWINHKPATLIKEKANGYKLSVGEFFTSFILNFGMIPFAFIISIIVYLYYFF